MAAPVHGIAMHGAPKYGPDFQHLDYANPDAPKGGELRRAVTGTFDNLNPFIIKGVAAPGRHHFFESLLKRTWDEPFSLYGLIAESINVPDDRSSVTFSLRPEAHFHDGSPITVDDVIFSWETLKEQGRPNHRLYYNKVRKIERPDARSVRFIFDTETPDRELPLILGLMPIVSKAYYSSVTFEQTTLTPPLGSGPYTIESVDAGRGIVYRRDPNYWGRNLPINRGLNNFDRISYDYYRDDEVMMEAFRAGEYDLRLESSAARWATGYDFPAVEDGRVTIEQLSHGRPSGLRAMVFNTRRPMFEDRAVRYALSLAFDFEWVNRALLQGAYVRTKGIFDNSELGFRGLPEGGELALLEPHRDSLPPELFDTAYHAPAVEGGLRANLAEARRLLVEAGWQVQDGTLQAGRGRPAARFRDPAGESGEREDRARLHPQSRTSRRGSEGAHRGHGPVPVPAQHLRLRHDLLPLGRVALAGKRAGVLLGRRGRGSGGDAQLSGDQGPGRRRTYRAHDPGAGARGLRRDHPRHGQDPDVGALRHPPLSPERRPLRLLEQVRPARVHACLRRRSRDLVGGARQGCHAGPLTGGARLRLKPVRKGRENAMAVSDLERRVETLESIEAIKRLKHQYCAYCDDGYDADGIAAQFVEEGIWDGGDDFGRYESREAIHAHFTRVSSQIVFAGHLVMNERLDVDLDSDSARGRWWIIMPATIVMEGVKTAVWLLGEYDDRYVRRDGTWMFESLTVDIHFIKPHKDGWVEA